MENDEHHSTKQSWGLDNVWMEEFKMLWDLGCHFWFITDFSSFSISSLVAFLDRCVSVPLTWIPVCKNPFRDVVHFPLFLFLVCSPRSLSYFVPHYSAVLFLLSLNTYFMAVDWCQTLETCTFCIDTLVIISNHRFKQPFYLP